MTVVAWCFQCGTQYSPGVEDCVECGLALVDEAPADAAEVGSSDEDQLAYELHEWAGESRRILDQVLTADGIAHAWQGATLVVRADDEETVDRAVAEAAETGGPALDPEGEKLAYEVADWAADEQSAFSELLVRLGIPHEFDEVGDLVVLADDEEAVESALDAFQGGSDERPELEGLDANGLLSDLFVACDRLRRDGCWSATDHRSGSTGGFGTRWGSAPLVWSTCWEPATPSRQWCRAWPVSWPRCCGS